jgi:hypothetical protein
MDSQIIFTDENVSPGPLKVYNKFSSNINVNNLDKFFYSNISFRMHCLTCGWCYGTAFNSENTGLLISSNASFKNVLLMKNNYLCDPFVINSLNGTIELKHNHSLDYVLVSTYQYLVVFTAFNKNLYSQIALTANLTIILNDVNSPPIIYLDEDYIVYIHENILKNGDIIAQVNVTDDDFKHVVAFDEKEYCTDKCGLKYFIVSGASSVFEIDANSGVIKIKNYQKIDYENQLKYELIIKVIDRNGLGLFSVDAIHIEVLDFPDCYITNVF